MNLFSLHALKKYILSVLFSLLVTMVLFGIISVVFTFFSPAPWLVKSISDYSIFFTVFLCSFLSARTSRGQGLLTGIISALFCLFIIGLTGSVFSGNVLFSFAFLKILPLTLVCGGIGGILGINCR